jgi:hypothetical protein
MPLIQPATINAHLNKFGAIIRFGRDERLIVGNPIAGIAMDDPVHPSEKRNPFSPKHLQSIFSGPPWDAPFVAGKIRPARFWVPPATRADRRLSRATARRSLQQEE